MKRIQRDLHKQSRDISLAARERITGLVRKLDAAQLNERPEPTGWSVAEVLEHLCVSDEILDPPTRRAIAAARPDASAPLREWKPTLLGRMVAGALVSPRKFKAPKAFRPGPAPRNGVLEAFRRIDQGVVSLMEDASQHDWRAIKVGSPALPGFMPKYNLGDVFNIHALHTTRHAAQIERLVGKL